MTNLEAVPDKQTILDAESRIREYVHRTPVMRCRTLDDLVGSELHFKCENLQKIGAFKIRGATNAILSLSDDEAKLGVATHSSGNHAQALALAARNRGIKATIVMPENAPGIKKSAVKGYGAEIIFCKPTTADREQTLERYIQKSGAILIHPYNDYRIIAGQATAAKELMEDMPDVADAILAPVGGGGLLSGTCLSARYFSSNTEVWGIEPAMADDAFRSFRDGFIHPSENPATIADGLLTSLGDKTFPIIKEHCTGILTVSEHAIRQSIRLIMERMKLVVEPSGAVTLAALLEYPEQFKGKTIGLIISGGNVDITSIPQIL
ncbi:MAG: threonine/serine dehydratase [Flavobacteriales bacterium]|nr:threonine/serine dehydratase [Flavobacteriales bacterium]